MKTRYAFALLAAALAAPFAHAYPTDGIKDLDVAALEPDAIVWANPYDGEKPRVLFLTFDNETLGAACVAHRLEMDYEVLSSGCAWDWQDSPERRERWRDVLAKDYDVCVLGSRMTMSGPPNIPAQFRNSLLAKAAQGMGVITLWHWHWPFPGSIIDWREADARGQDALPGMPIDLRLIQNLAAPADEEGKQAAADPRIDARGRFIPAGFVREVIADRKTNGFFVWTAQRADTRMVRTHMDERGYRCRGNFVNGGTYTRDMYIYEEYWLSFLCNAILWAAHREPAAYVERLSLQGDTIEAAGEEPIACRVPVKGLKPLNGTLEAVVRDYYFNPVHAQNREVEVAAGDQAFDLSIPPLDAGNYLVDVWLKRDGKTVDWANGHFHVKRPGAVTAVTLARAVHDRGDPIEGTVTLEGAPAGAELGLRLEDSWGRVVARHRSPAADGPVPFSFAVDPAVGGIGFRLTAELAVGERVHFRAERPFPIRKPAADYMFIYCLSEDNGSAHIHRIRRAALEPWRSDGDNYADNAFTASVLAWDNLEPNCHGASAGYYIGGSFGHHKTVYDEPTLARFREKVEALAGELAPYGQRFFNTGDDSGPSRDFGEKNEARFQDYLKERYGSLDELNKTWGVALANWTNATQKLVGEEKGKQNYVPTADAFRFGEDVFYGHHRRLREAAQAVNPDVAIGNFASGWGAGLGQFMEAANYVNPYWRDFWCEILGAFHGKAPGLYGVNGGYGAGPFEPWYPLLSGCNILHTWCSSSQMDGNLQILPKNMEFNRNIREIKEGIDIQVRRAEMQFEPVAVLYSRWSGWASELDSTMAEIANSRNNVNAILNDLGVQYRYVYGRQLVENVLEEEGIALLVLPYCQALRADECDAIGRFVRQGGTVLADARPAVWDENCRQLERGRLDDVFGITRTAAEDYVVFGDLKLTVDLPGLARGDALVSTTGDSSITPTTAKAHAEVGGAPAVLVNAYGKGRAVLMNSFIGRYKLQQADGESRKPAALYRWIARQAGVETDRIRAVAGGQEAIGVRRVLFRNGDMNILGVAKRGMAFEEYPVAVSFALPAESHVYEMRGGRYLGSGTAFEDTFDAEHVKFYALVPYRVQGVAVELPAEAARGNTLEAAVRISASGGTPAPHAVFVQVRGPDGTLCDWWEQKLMVHGGNGVVRLPIAENETPGEYTLLIKDVPTGMVAEGAFAVP